MTLLCIAIATLARPIDPNELDSRIAAVLPKASEEKYLQIPWRFDLAAARVESKAKNKPMFLWIMNGHPMGCT